MSNVASWMTEGVESKQSAWSHEKESRRKYTRNPDATQVREANKRLRVIFEEGNVEYGKDVSDKDLPERFRVAASLRQKNVKFALRKIYQTRNVELCFVVDVTGSMQSHIDAVKNSIKKIVSLLKQPKSTTAPPQTANNLRLALVAYRDFGDKKQFEILKFTESVEEFETFCGTIIAKGGGDTPEDIFGAFEEAFKLGWSYDYGTKVIFHIADAPCHGKKYHDADDKYPDGDPNKRSEEGMFLKIIDLGIDYYFGKINSSTDKMIEIFAKAYGKPIFDFDVKDVVNITTAVFTAVSSSVGMSSKTYERMPNQKAALKIVEEIPNWETVIKKEGRFLDYEMPESIDDIINDVPLKRNTPQKAMIQIADNPFAHGAERYAFYGRDVSGKLPENIVLKEYIRKGPETSAAISYEITNQIQTVAAYFAEQYTKEFKKANKKAYPIKYLKVKTLCLTGGTNRYLSCEKQYDKDEVFLRFTNNADYEISKTTSEKYEIKEEFIWALTAFSHWTYQVTNKNLMVVDLQGILAKNPKGKQYALLTDPAIHCVDETRFGRMNLGRNGMQIFFHNHKCNIYCQSLKLEPVNI